MNESLDFLFEEFIQKLMSVKGNDLLIYQSVLGMVHTLISEYRVSEIDTALRAKFPEYYHD